MKRLTLLALLSTPTFAHQTPFDQPDFLKMSNGDPIAAQELSWFCAANGKSLSDCKESLSGNGNLKQEAARKCVRDSIAALPQIKIANQTKEIPGSRAHQAEGVRWHNNYIKSPETGRLHRHDYSANQREDAYQKMLTIELVASRQRIDSLTGGVSTGKTLGSETSWSQGLSDLVTSTLNKVVSESTTSTKGITLPEGEMDEAIRKANLARQDPSLLGIQPEILCYIDERDCDIGSSGKITNESYDPSKDEKKDADKGKKSDDKKGANNNPPKHEDETTHDIPDNTSTTGGDSWVGNDTARNPDDPMIANPASEDLAAKSPIESCLDKEFNKLIQDEGSKTKAPNAEEAQNFRKEKAENLLKAGYCDESYYGKSYCQAHKNRQASVVPITIIQERKEAAESAIKSFHNTGICNPNVLGREFCKAQLDRWTTTPAEKLEIIKPFKPGTSPTRPFSGN